MRTPAARLPSRRLTPPPRSSALPRLVIAALLLMTAARAGYSDDAKPRPAERHFERGEKLYALARFAEALDAYQRAFDAEPIADLLFNIAQCHRNLEDYDAAIFSYQKYLELAPEAVNRDAVEQLIRKLESRKQAADSRRLGLRHKQPVAPEPDGPVYRRWWFWTGIALVGAAGGIGIYSAARSSPPTTDLGNVVIGK
jgi:tetratricopeptide (TPR) repeat protein